MEGLKKGEKGMEKDEMGMAGVGEMSGSAVEWEKERWEKERRYPKPGTEPWLKAETAEEKGGMGVQEWVRWVEEKGMVGITEEFGQVGVSDLELSEEEEKKLAFSAPENAVKNRHSDVMCLDETRVVLRDGLPGDYIHASTVRGYRHDNAYILAQAPLQATLVDFWRMVWQEKVGVIVMVTRLEESTTKATNYWPVIPQSIIRYGPIFVHNLSTNKKSNYMGTELEVWNVGVEGKRRVYHFYYQDWPDHCVPLFMGGFIHFMERVRQLHYQCATNEDGKEAKKRKTSPGPLLVHCSAGIGRSGTFVALDMAFRQLIANRRVDLGAVVRRLRRQRHGAVQTPDQFLFAHIVILYLLKHEALIKPATVDVNAILKNYK